MIVAWIECNEIRGEASPSFPDFAGAQSGYGMAV